VNARGMRYGILALVTSAQAGAAVIQQGMGSLGPFFTAEFSLNRAQLGLIFGGLMVGCTATTLASGVAVDAFGERRMILFSGLSMGVALIAATLVHSYWWLFGWMVLAGVGYAAATPAGGRAILLWFERNRGSAMGIRQMGVPIGGFIGAPAMNFQYATRGEDASQLSVADGTVRIAGPIMGPTTGSRLIVGIRPEHVQLAENDRGAIHGTVEVVEPLVAERQQLVTLDVAGRPVGAPGGAAPAAASQAAVQAGPRAPRTAVPPGQGHIPVDPGEHRAQAPHSGEVTTTTVLR